MIRYQASHHNDFGYMTSILFNPLPNNIISAHPKLKALADEKINVTQKLKFVSGRVENILGKGEDAGYQHFLFLPKYFQKPASSGSLKFGIVC